MKLGHWKIVAEAEGKEVDDLEQDELDLLSDVIDQEVAAAIEDIRERVAYLLQERLPNEEIAVVSLYIEDWA